MSGSPAKPAIPSARGRDRADLERADGNAAERAAQTAVGDGAAVARARGAGHQVQAGPVIGADPDVGTGRALVAGLEQPQARERDVLVLDQPARA
jgi:hypothetical protein